VGPVAIMAKEAAQWAALASGRGTSFLSGELRTAADDTV